MQHAFMHALNMQHINPLMHGEERCAAYTDWCPLLAWRSGLAPAVKARGV